METIYKLTRPDGTTYGEFQWEPGKLYRFPGGGELCTAAYAHGYRTPAMAVLMNPMHANFDSYVLWRGEGVVEIDDGTKVGLTECVLHKQIEAPLLTIEQRVEFGLRCAMLVCADPTWLWGANAWLNYTDSAAGAAAMSKSAHMAGSAAAEAWAAVSTLASMGVWVHAAVAMGVRKMEREAAEAKVLELEDSAGRMAARAAALTAWLGERPAIYEAILSLAEWL